MSRSQRVRRIVVLFSALIFPITFMYFSPAVVFEAGSQGILSGSYLTFAGLFLSAIVSGRAWCGWACPGAGFDPMFDAVDGRRFGPPRARIAKYVIWTIWLVALVLVVGFVGHGFRTVDPLFMTQAGLSTYSVFTLSLYFGVMALIVAPAAIFGRRGFCHTVCWMAPFMVLGRKLGNALGLPRLQLAAAADKCTDCGRCEKTCPMSLPLSEMVKSGRMENVDCILCGSCSERCVNDVLHLRFGR